MKSIFVANWKMNPGTFKEAKKLFDATKKAAEASKSISIIVAPPTIFLRDLRAGYKGKRVAFAAQSAHAETGGAFTGELSLAQCKDVGATHVIVGHAERRAMGETNEETGKKVGAALALKMTPILCVGETARGAGGEHFDVVRAQLRAGFTAVEPTQTARVIIVYEPLWTIGKSSTMDPRDMHEMAIFIRKTIVDLKGTVGMNIKILYGGSIDDSNATNMLQGGDVIGFLVGRASINSARLTALLQTIEAGV